MRSASFFDFGIVRFTWEIMDVKRFCDIIVRSLGGLATHYKSAEAMIFL